MTSNLESSNLASSNLASSNLEFDISTALPTFEWVKERVLMSIMAQKPRRIRLFFATT